GRQKGAGRRRGRAQAPARQGGRAGAARRRRATNRRMGTKGDGGRMTGRDRLILALDVPSQGEALQWIERVGEAVGFYKVGLQLFCAEGPRVAAAVRRYGRVFLDLKLHDIPETVSRAMAAAAATGAEMVTVHAGGGRKMLTRSTEVAHDRGMEVLGVTVLTSLDERDLSEIGASGSLGELVLRRAHLAAEAGCDGVVAPG